MRFYAVISGRKPWPWKVRVTSQRQMDWWQYWYWTWTKGLLPKIALLDTHDPARLP